MRIPANMRNLKKPVKPVLPKPKIKCLANRRERAGSKA